MLFILACPLDFAKSVMWWYVPPDWSRKVPLHVTYHQCMVASGPVLNICTSPKKMPFYRWKLSHAFGYLVSHVHLFKLILTCTPLVFYLGVKQRMATHERASPQHHNITFKNLWKYIQRNAHPASVIETVFVISLRYLQFGHSATRVADTGPSCMSGDCCFLLTNACCHSCNFEGFGGAVFLENKTRLCHSPLGTPRNLCKRMNWLATK